MKNLEKLTLNELKSSVFVLSDLETCNAIVGGEEPFSTNLLPEVTVTPTSNILPSVNVAGISTLSALNANNGAISYFPPNGDTIGGLTPSLQYSAACAQGYTQAAQVLFYIGAAVGISFFEELFPVNLGLHLEDIGTHGSGMRMDEEMLY